MFFLPARQEIAELNAGMTGQPGGKPFFLQGQRLVPDKPAAPGRPEKADVMLFSFQPRLC